ncbi:MAG: organomercurial lyase [Acidobacteriota bacterium]
MNQDLDVKLAVYRFFAAAARRPTPEDVARTVGAPVDDVLGSYARLRAQRVLVLEEDGASIRMAPPFSGVATQHVAVVGAQRYFANCAWDAMGIPAALGQPASIESRCEQSGQPLRLFVGRDGPEPSDWLFHCAVPAAHWWDDIVLT